MWIIIITYLIHAVVRPHKLSYEKKKKKPTRAFVAPSVISSYFI